MGILELVRVHLMLGADRDESGATAVEYGLLVALIAGVIVGVVTLLGLSLPGGFQTVINSI